MLGIVGTAILMMVMASASTAEDTAKVHFVANELETLSQRVELAFPNSIILDLPLQIREI
jgi:hypothetical protein